MTKNKKLENCIENDLRQQITKKLILEHENNLKFKTIDLVEALKDVNKRLLTVNDLQKLQIEIYKSQLENSKKLFEEIYPDRNFEEETTNGQHKNMLRKILMKRKALLL